MSKKYTSAKMHEGTFAAGIGTIQKELSVNGDAVHKAVESITYDGGSLVTVVIKDKVGKKVTLDIPLSNFENLRE